MSTPGALMEYAVILFMLKKRRMPFHTIDRGLKHLFPTKTSNGEATQPLQSPTIRENNNPQVRQQVATTFIFAISLLLNWAAVYSETVNCQQISQTIWKLLFF